MTSTLAIKKKALVVIVWQDSLGKSNKILLLRRQDKDGGFWQPVTGYLEERESFREGAIREAEEETSFSGFLKDLELAYTFTGRWGEAEEKCFSMVLFSKAPPSPKIDPKEHVEWEWLSPIEAYERVKFPKVKEAVQRAGQAPFFLSRGGVWFQEGEEITHERTIALLHKSLVKRDGVFVVRIGNSEALVIVEDCPLYVTSLDTKNHFLTLLGGRKAKLDPTTLELGPDQAFYCTIDGLRAKFFQSAHYNLCNYVKEKKDSGEYFFHWQGRVYPISISPKGKGKDGA